MIWSVSGLLLSAALVSGPSQGSPTQFDQWTVEHFQRARQAQQENRLEEAAREYQEVLTRNPRFAEVYLNLGIVYHLQAQYADAIKTLQAGISINPDLQAAQVLLGISYYMVQDFKAAVRPLDRVLRANPRERQAGLYLALSFLGLDEPEKAARQLRETAKYFPDDVEIDYNLGEAYNEAVRQSARSLLTSSRDSALYHWGFAIAAERKSDTSTAILEYLKALALDPNIAPLYERLSVLFRHVGMPDLAEAAVQRLADLGARPETPRNVFEMKPATPEDEKTYRRLWRALPAVEPDPTTPHFADSFVNRAVKQRLDEGPKSGFAAAYALYAMGRFQDAAEQLQAMPSKPKDWLTPYLLARSYVAAGDYDRAEQVIENALVPYLKVPSIALLRMEIQTELSLRCYDRVLSKQPASMRAKLLRAKSYAAAFQPDKAVEIYQEVLQTQPRLPQVHLSIAQIYGDQLHWTAAIEELRKELELSADNGMALALLGHAYAEVQLPDAAIEVLSQVLKRYPDDASALADLGKAWTQKGEPAKAIEAFQRALLCDPGQYPIHYRLFQLYRLTGKMDRAQQHLEAFQAAKAGRKPKAMAGK